MRLLLDTHAIMWWWLDDASLPLSTRGIIGDRSNEIFVSSVTGLEIAIKVRIGKLPTMAEAIHRYDILVREWGFVHLDVTQSHAVSAGLLVGDHRDLFDRLIAAQAISESMTIVTRDPEFAGFGCEVIW